MVGKAVLGLLLIALVAFTACDCGGKSDDASATSDDDSIGDDDSSLDDDDDSDDDAGTTTTTTPTTTTTGATGTTTTVTSPSSTTTTTIPGSGSACDPFRYTAADGPDVPDFGPWPEYTIGAITYRQYISGSAGVGRNAVALDADGRAWVFGMVGRSFDAYVFDDDASVERQIVDPAGGANSEIFRDAGGAFHVVYINTNRNEIRYATNATGEWTRTLILSVPAAGLDIGAARAADGTLHIAYACLESDDTGVQYLTWHGGIVAEESIRDPDDENWFWSPSIALDSANRPRVAYSGDLGIRVVARSDSGWEERFTTDGFGDTEILIDENNATHIAYGGDPIGLYVADDATGSWTSAAIDRCGASPGLLTQRRDATGAYHILYASSGGSPIRHARKSGDTWTIERINGMPAYYLGATVAPDGTLRTAAGSIYEDDKFYYATNGNGTWTRRLIAGGREFAFSNFAVDADGNPHFVFAESRSPEHGRMFYATTAGEWRMEEIDSDAHNSRADIALSSADIVYITYVDHYDVNELKVVIKNSGEWTNDSVFQMEDVIPFSIIRMDEAERPYVGFQFQDYPSMGNLLGPTWQFESIPFDVSIVDMESTDTDDWRFLVANFAAGEDSIDLVTRMAIGTWSIEHIVEPTLGYLSAPDLSLDGDGFAHVIYCCDSTGVGYGNNIYGSWEIDNLGFWNRSESNYAIAADQYGKVHIVLSDFDGSRPGQNGVNIIYYANNVSDDFEFFQIDDRWPIDTGITDIHILPDDRLMVAYQPADSICTATFEPGLD